MSRDMTPKDLHMAQKALGITDNIVNHLYKINEDGTRTPAFSEKSITINNKYPVVSMFGGSLIDICLEIGVFSTEKGCQLFQQIEDYFKGKEIEDKELLDKTIAWYEGKLCPGYYMDANNGAFAEYLKFRLK